MVEESFAGAPKAYGTSASAPNRTVERIVPVVIVLRQDQGNRGGVCGEDCIHLYVHVNLIYGSLIVQTDCSALDVSAHDTWRELGMGHFPNNGGCKYELYEHSHATNRKHAGDPNEACDVAELIGMDALATRGAIMIGCPCS